MGETSTVQDDKEKAIDQQAKNDMEDIVSGVEKIKLEQVEKKDEDTNSDTFVKCDETADGISNSKNSDQDPNSSGEFVKFENASERVDDMNNSTEYVKVGDTQKEKKIAEAKKAEEARLAEEKQIAEAKQAEEARLAEEKKIAEAKKAEEARLAEEKKIAEEARLVEEKRL